MSTSSATTSSLGSREMALFVLDCSKSMGLTTPFFEGSRDYQVLRSARPLDVMLVYIKAKIAQRIMRDLKTIPCGVITYAVPKTKNVLTNEMKQRALDERVSYDRRSDVYRHFYEHISIQSTPSRKMLEELDLVQAGEGPDSLPPHLRDEQQQQQLDQEEEGEDHQWNADIHNALLVAIKTLEYQPRFKTYKKEIYLLTNGESKTDWEGWKATVAEMNAKGIGLVVVGMNFNDEQIGYNEDGKSDIKKENEKYLHKIMGRLEKGSTVATATRALSDIAQPTIKVVNSASTKTTLSLGDVVENRDRSLLMQIEIKKAIVPAPIKTMKQMSMRGFDQLAAAAAAANANATATLAATTSSDSKDKTHRQDGASDEEGAWQQQGTSSNNARDPDPSGSAARPNPSTDSENPAAVKNGGGFNLGKLGKTFDKTLSEAGLAISDALDSDLMTHAVLRETRYFYRPIETPESEESKGKRKDKSRMEGQEIEDDPLDDEERAEAAWRPTGNAELTEAYYYGGSLVDVGGLEPGVGELKGNQTGMEFIGFMKKSEIRYDWRLGDILYVYPQSGYTGSQYLFSALHNGMLERKSVGVVRYIGKGSNTQTRGFKVPDPKIGLLWPEVDSSGQEFCYWCQMPFSEDLRMLAFPSLDNFFNGRGERVTEHPYIATQAMDDAMEEYVDAMDLVDPSGDVDTTGTPKSWFNVSDSYSPAIHNIINTLTFRLSDAEAELPPIPTSLTKYLDPPPEVVARSEHKRKAAISAFEVKRVPPKPKKVNKKAAHYAGDEPEAVINFERIFSPTASPSKQAPSTNTFANLRKPTAPSSIFPTTADMDVDEGSKPERSSLKAHTPDAGLSLPPSSPPERKPTITPASSPVKEHSHAVSADESEGEQSIPEPDTDDD